MKKFLAAMVATSLMLASLSSCASKPVQTSPGASGDNGTSAYDQKETIKIGMVTSKTGVNSFIGDINIEGATLAVQQINDAGGVLGKQLELVIEDAGEDQQSNVVATTKILSAGEISAMFHTWASSDSISASPMILEYKIPTIASGSSANVYKEGNPFLWQVRMTDDKNAPLMTSVAVENLNIKKPAILHSTDSFGQGYADNLLAAMKEHGIEPAAVFSFNAGENNFAPLVSQIASSGCDGVISIGQDNEAILIMKQFKLTGPDVPYLGSNVFGTRYILEAAGESAADGWYTMSDWVSSVDTEKSHEFVAGFEKMFSGKEPTMQSLYAYDSIHIFAKAIELAGSADPVAINEALGQIKDLEGAMAIYTPNESRSFASTTLLVKNKGLNSEIVDVIYRDK